MGIRDFRFLLACAALLGGAALIFAGDLRLPGNHRGFAPEQPIAFSHRLHSGELQIQCLYCHSGAERSRHAGIPEASLCMNCHLLVTARRDTLAIEEQQAKASNRAPALVVAPELRKLYRALGLDDQRQRDPALPQVPIAWVRVHRLPDFVYFDHRPHVLGGLACEVCHGPVQAMERVRQESDLSMGWCVTCHRARTVAVPFSTGRAPVSTDCATCHF